MSVKKILLFGFFAVFVLSKSLADEGMWMPNLLEKRQVDMQNKGLKISANDIYHEIQPSLKDAVVRFGTGCSGSFISKEGLVLTNYHCGYGQIQALSSVQNDYLQHGFWAKNRHEELPCAGLTVSMVVRTIDVTDAVKAGTTAGMSELEAAEIRRRNTRDLIDEIEKQTEYKAEVRAFFGGNQFYLYLTETFEDVRLVGTPPSSIGKFGGDVDNWTWPRHTGDFALFRVYADPNNKPAKYSPNNVPYQPKKHFKISLNGAQENEFTWIFGYPGRTNLYLTSFGIRQITEIENPIAIHARTKRLDIIRPAMEQDQKTRIQYSAKAAGISNAWKRWQGENYGIQRVDGIAKKEGYEKRFQEWANTFNNGQYRDLLSELKTAYDEMEPLLIQNTIFNEHVLSPEIVNFVNQFVPLIKSSSDKNFPTATFNAVLSRVKGLVTPFFKDFNVDIDKQIFKALSTVEIDCEQVRFIDFPDKNFDKYVDEMYAKSIFTNEKKLNDALRKSKKSNVGKVFGNDPLYVYVNQIFSMYNAMISPALREQRALIDVLQRTYMQAQMEMESDRMFFPDANSTIRIAYGKVEGLTPSDAVTYRFQTTLSGLMAKENPEIFEFTINDKLRDLYNNKDFGVYANAKGEMPICFIASNHTIGGNSGSPVLNGNGDMIGINFDRAWEGTMSGFMFDPKLCRNISVDVRFILFIIDKFAESNHIMAELEVVK
ncbi:MAG: S46 family peptidase [Bacteroidales bacterium]|nr:S46 family peptidase [Bacteroidales bacterium]